MAKSKLEVVEGLGYRESDIERELGPERYAQFNDWMCGQTVAVANDGEPLIYPWDYERFLAGLPVID